MFTIRRTILLLIALPLIKSKSSRKGVDEETSVVVSRYGPAAFGSNITLTCSFPELNEIISLFWFKENDIIYANDNEKEWTSSRVKALKINFKGPKESVLSIDDLHVSDDGRYECLVGTGGQQIKGVFELEVEPDVITVPINESVLLHCHQQYSRMHQNDIETAIWKKDKYIISMGEKIAIHNSRFSSVNNNLFISNMTSFEEGMYTCFIDGKRIHSHNVVLPKGPVVPSKINLYGWRGILFAVAVAGIIIVLIAGACVVQLSMNSSYLRD